ncbi:MAG: ribonuclease P protein component [Vitreoscilla sp.]|nr:ribonuclease P protein component [Burkholderiales bacterium]MBP6337885.1 ribonuclease P protein component [Vitreoscilla sp.]MBP6674464.1 ribonuclease P protein component [Vitreoscilla sp.]
MIGRIVRPADFERVLGAPQRSRSTHFAVHYVAGAPSRARATSAAAACEPVVQHLSPELSTEEVPTTVSLVDGCQHWLGLVVPKRHARRAVTRNLIKRQLRAAMGRHVAELPGGLWVVRLRAPFDREQFVSPASEALREAAHGEADALFQQAAHAPLAPSQAGRRMGGPRRGKAKPAAAAG